MPSALKAAARSAYHDALRNLPLEYRRKVYFMKAHRRWANFKHPTSFSEKVNWRIIHDRRNLIAWTCDKQAMKEHAARVGGVYVPATLWSGEHVSELAEVELPQRWVLKPNHRSQLVWFGSGSPQVTELALATKDWMRGFQAENLGEWAYTQARPALFVEEWIADNDTPPPDYKFFVFEGQPRWVQVDGGRHSRHTRDYYRVPDWEWVPVKSGAYPQAGPSAPPDLLAEMVDAAARLGAGFDFIRIDLYATRERGVVFGETTPYPGGGLRRFQPRGFDLEMGAVWRLPDFPN